MPMPFNADLDGLEQRLKAIVVPMDDFIWAEERVPADIEKANDMLCLVTTIREAVAEGQIGYAIALTIALGFDWAELEQMPRSIPPVINRRTA